MKFQKMNEKNVTLWLATTINDRRIHYSPKHLAYGLLEEIGTENICEIDIKTINEGLIDLPGTVQIDRSYQEIKIDTFRLVIPSEDFEHIYDSFASSPLQNFRKGEEFHRMDGHVSSIMVTPQQHQVLCEAMEQMLSHVRKENDRRSHPTSRQIVHIYRDIIKQKHAKDISSQRSKKIFN